MPATTTPARREPDLVALLVQASYDQYAATTQQLIASLEKQNADLRATLAAIRDGVTEATEGSFMPTPAHLTARLWPEPEVVDRYRDEAAS